MKLLIGWNTCGAFTPIADEFEKQGHEIIILVRKGYDELNKSPDAIIIEGSTEFLLKWGELIKEFKPDVIQISSSIKMLVMARFYAPKTPIVFTWHGADIRERESIPKEIGLADYVTVTTKDLSLYGEYLGRVIPSEFYYRGGRIKGTAFMLYNYYYPIDQREFAKTWCKERNIRLTIIDRTKGEFIPYSHMPEYLSKFEYVLDFKGHLDGTLSRLALEAFHCGCRVIHDSKLDSPLTYEELGMLPTVEFYTELYLNAEKASNWTTIKRMFRLFISIFKWRILGRSL